MLGYFLNLQFLLICKYSSVKFCMRLSHVIGANLKNVYLIKKKKCHCKNIQIEKAKPLFHFIPKSDQILWSNIIKTNL